MESRERLLTPGEVASLFRVDPKTVTRWAAAGRMTSIRTPGGHRRFRESEVRALLSGERLPGEAVSAQSPVPQPESVSLDSLPVSLDPAPVESVSLDPVPAQGQSAQPAT